MVLRTLCDGEVSGGRLSLTSVLEDVTPDPAAEAKTRAARIGEIVWWVHRWQAYRRAVDRLGEGAIGLPERATWEDLVAGCRLTRAQERLLKPAGLCRDEPGLLRLVAAAADA